MVGAFAIGYAIGTAIDQTIVEPIQNAQRGKKNVRQTEFEGMSDAEVDEIADSDPDPNRRARAKTEQKARGTRNKQKRGKKCD